MNRIKTIFAIAAIAAGILVASGSSALGDLDVKLVSQTSTTITLGWTPQGKFGYLFFNKCDNNFDNCTLVSRTNDSTKNTVKFSKGAERYKVSVITEGNNGGYPPVTPPPPPPPPPPSGTAPWLGSFNASYQNAQPGQTVIVPAGSYGTQVIAYRSLPTCDPNNASQLVTLRVPSTVTINGDLEVHGSCVFISGVTTGSMDNWKARSFTLNVTGYTSVEGDSSTQWPRGVRFEGLNTGNLITASSEQVIVRDADVGPRLLDVPCQFPENRISSNGVSGKQVRDVLWDRVAIHDQNRTLAAANQDCHYGGLQVWNVANLTIRDSVFERNVVYHIDVDSPQNFRLERVRFSCPSDNSWLGDRCAGQRAVQFNANTQSTTFVDNISANGPNGLYGCYSPGCTLTGVVESGTVNLAESTTAPSSSQPPPPSSGNVANIWVNSTAGSNPSRCATPCAYDSTKAFSSLDAASAVCGVGDVIRVKSGTSIGSSLTGSTSVNNSNGRFGTCTVKAETDGAKVTVIGTLSVFANWLTFDNFTWNGQLSNATDDWAQFHVFGSGVTFNNADSSSFQLFQGDGIKVEGGDIGPCIADKINPVCVPRVMGPPATLKNVTLKNVNIHDQLAVAPSVSNCGSDSCHTDGLAIFGGSNILLDGVSIWNSQVAAIRIQNCCGNEPQNVTIQNSRFHQVWGSYDVNTNTISNPIWSGIDVDTPVPNLIIRFNSFYTRPNCPIEVGCGNGSGTLGKAGTPADIYGNIWAQPGPSCGANSNVHDNMFKKWSDVWFSQCGSTNTLKEHNFNYPYVNLLPYGTKGESDMHITGPVWEGDGKVTAGCIPFDADGKPRGTPCDAGAYER